MTPRENAMAILNREQPDYYFDLMDALVILPDPQLLAGGKRPEEGGACLDK